MMTSQPIGIFDSGVGGLTVLRKLNDLLPQESLIYLGDTARVPYGNNSPELIRIYAQQCTQFLLQQAVKLIVVACNTVSAVALDAIRQISPVPIIGVIEPGANAAILKAPRGKIGVIGTRATIQSKAYDNALKQLNPMVTIVAQDCPLFVPITEEGWQQHSVAQLIAHEYLQALAQAEVECLILGCTHYPLLKPLIQQILPNVNLIDSGEEAALVAQAILKYEGLAAKENQARTINCYVTDLSATFSVIAERFLGMPFSLLQQVSLNGK